MMFESFSAWGHDHPRLTLCIRMVASPALVVLFGWIVLQDLLSSIFTASLDIHWWLFVPFTLSIAFFTLCIQPSRTSISRGSAHWATLAELRTAHLINTPVPAAVPQLPAAGGTTAMNPANGAPESLLEIGLRGKHRIALTERQQESHVLIVAPTGKRKSSGFFIPALLQERGHRSMLVNDVKDELYRLCASAMSQYHDILVFSPTRPGRSTRYNPLAHIKTSKDARDFATAWVTNTGLSREEFYNVASIVFITALTLHVVDTELGAPLGRLADLVTKPVDEIKALLLTSRSDRARNTAATFIQTLDDNPKLASGILLGVSNRFSILIDSPEYRAVTATNEISFEQMIDSPRPIALFLNVPTSAVDDLKPLTSVLIMQMMDALTRRAEQEPSGQLPRHFVLYLDELANAGRIPDLEKHITLVRGAGMAVIGAIQDFGQLERVYSRDIAGTLLSNFTSQIALPGLGQVEAEYYSRRLGTTTVETISTTKTSSQSGGNQEGFLSLYTVGQGTSTTTSEAQRALLMPEEIRTMPVGSFILITDNAAPVRGQFRTYIERPELQALINLPIVVPSSLSAKSVLALPGSTTIPTASLSPAPPPQPPTLPPPPQPPTLPPPEHLM